MMILWRSDCSWIKWEQHNDTRVNTPSLRQRPSPRRFSRCPSQLHPSLSLLPQKCLLFCLLSLSFPSPSLWFSCIYISKQCMCCLIWGGVVNLIHMEVYPVSSFVTCFSHLCNCVYLQFIHFHSCIVFHHLPIPQITDPL